ncbi:MAG: hypothetical protein ACK5LC_14080 [Coprobacillaceae bacterium]
MTKNTMGDLNNHLFEQLERLNDEGITGKKLQTELKRAKAMSGIASNIIGNASLGLQAAKLKSEFRRDVELPEMLESKKND